ncbi:MAG: phosphopentomutase [Mycoplasmatota bacterium]
MKYRRIFLVVLDSVGVGNAHDADKFNDKGANTLLHTVNADNIELPNLKKLGFLNLIGEKENANSIYTVANEVSNGKDTLTGHLEMMGVITKKPFITYLDGFPNELIEKIEEISNRKVIGNINASGTEIIKNLGEEHMKTGSIIVYTSADSVLQIAAHEEVVPLEELYDICSKVRELTKEGKYKVGRIIARPFIGKNNDFKRTENRHDYALDPASDTVLDYLKENFLDVISIGKIADVFNNNGITETIKTKNNMDGILKIIDTLDSDFEGLCFANLNDFDSLYGHRRNPIGYLNCLKQFDDNLDELLSRVGENDLLILTADHGNDPTFKGTDHTREQIPVLMYNQYFQKFGKIEDLKTFSDIGKTILDNFNIENDLPGDSFLDKIK